MIIHVLLCALAIHTCAQDITTVTPVEPASPLVQISQGWVEGIGASDGDYYAFYGIPYGGSTAGENRFKPPTPAPTFDEVFSATNDSILCAQPGHNGVIGSEDCLSLSVFTKSVNTATTTTKPVLVWLIGEEYTISNPLQHSFRKLVEEDIVVVALNYRLSIFGFLCLGIQEAPGNAGLRDVIQGLQWIQNNIAEFSGDPNNVVLFGHGSGAAMVDLITMSPLAHNLVHKAIFHSGSALSPWAVSYDPIGSAESLGDIVGFEGNNRQDLVEYLKLTSVDELVDALNELEFLNSAVLFAPCVENIELNPDDTFLPDAPWNLLQSGEFHHIPHIVGYTDLEGTIRVNEAVDAQWLQKMHNNFDEFLPIDLELDEETREEVSRITREYYFGLANINITTIHDYFKYHGDISMSIPVIRSASLRALRSTGEIRVFEFEYRGTNNSDWDWEDHLLTGVPHGGFLNYLLDFDLASTGDNRVMQSVVERYVKFCYTGQPTVELGTGVTWFSIERSFRWYIRYSGGDVIEQPGLWMFSQNLLTNPLEPQYAFWSNLYDKYYRVPPPTPTSSAARTSASLAVLLSLFYSLY